MEASSSSEQSSAGSLSRVPFGIAIALVILFLSVLYALVFSRMIYDSTMEQHFAPQLERARYEGPLHLHNWAEWVLLFVPALAGWLGVIGSLNYLLRRWLRSLA